MGASSFGTAFALKHKNLSSIPRPHVKAGHGGTQL